MKYLFFAVLWIVLFACSEVPVTLPSGPGSSSGDFTQNVLIEEFTGVRCQNCPAGAKLLEDLKSIYGDRLAVVSVHGGFFAQPTNAENKLTLDNNYGKELIRIFNQPLGYPSAIINRKSFDNNLFIGGNSWAGYIKDETLISPKIGLNLDINKNNSTRKINLGVSINGLEDLSSVSLYLSVLITENNIKDAQLTPTGVDVNYIHNHVLRAYLTSLQGDAIMPIKLNEKKSYTYSIDIPDNWNIDNLNMVALVNKGGPNFEVVQVVEK
ncbi:MAG: Omp28-related outer membrane protein [Saprospiraceae bacterium]